MPGPNAPSVEADRRADHRRGTVVTASGVPQLLDLAEVGFEHDIAAHRDQCDQHDRVERRPRNVERDQGAQRRTGEGRERQPRAAVRRSGRTRR